MPQAFISFSHHDESQAREIAAGLEAAGVRSWIYTGSITAGEKWPKVLGEAIADAEALILVWSKAAAVSELVELEWNIAIALKKTILPWVRDGTALPAALQPYQAIHGEGPEALVEAVRHALGNPRRPDRQAATQLILDRLETTAERAPKQVLEAVKTVLAQQGWVVTGNLYQPQGDIHIYEGFSATAWARRWPVWLGLVVAVLAAVTLIRQPFGPGPRAPNAEGSEAAGRPAPPAQLRVIAGVISDEQGKPVAGVTVSLPAANVSTLTNETGYYHTELSVSSHEPVLLIADKVGYEVHQTYVSPGNTNMNFTLHRAR